MAASRIRPLVAGNWKMNGLNAALGEARRVRDGLGQAGFAAGVDAMICPPATLIAALAGEAAGSRLQVGGQDCHARPSGAHTGDISAEMLKDAGAVAVIVGHSERRADHGERDGDVKAKALAAHRAGLAAIVCVGETAGERAAGLTLAVVGRQLAASLPEKAAAGDTIVAYEPVWAIGTGLTPTAGDVAEVHDFLRRALAERFGTEGQAMRILYGGSVKPDNARALLAVGNVNGALVGGASLKADDFLAIIAACGA
jgi:triosephosphate isomerase (TIM)